MTAIAITFIVAFGVTLALLIRVNNISSRQEVALKMREYDYVNDLTDIKRHAPIAYDYVRTTAAFQVYAIKQYGAELSGYDIREGVSQIAIKVAEYPFAPGDDYSEAYARNLAEDTRELLNLSGQRQPAYPKRKEVEA